MSRAIFSLTLVVLVAFAQASSKLKSSALRKSVQGHDNLCKFTLMDDDYDSWVDDFDFSVFPGKCYHALWLPFDLDNDIKFITFKGKPCNKCSGKLFADKNEKGESVVLNNEIIVHESTQDYFYGIWNLKNLHGMNNKISSFFFCC